MTIQRRATIAIFMIQIVGALLGLLFFLITGEQPSALIALAVALPILAALLVSYWRGWELARYINLLIVSALVAGPLVRPALAPGFSPVVLIPAGLALVLANNFWIAGTTLGVIGVVLVRAGGQGGYTRLSDLLAYFVVAGGLIVGRMIAEQNQRAADLAVRQATAERERAERQARAAAEQTAELAHQNAEQQRLLSLVAALETPAVTIGPGVLLVPLVGAFDTARFESMTERLLAEVHRQRARLVVLDVAGSSTIDGPVAQALITLANAIQLLGCAVTLSGITADVASALVAQEVALHGLTTVRSPQEALAQFQPPHGARNA